jgi:hypothetical protein
MLLLQVKRYQLQSLPLIIRKETENPRVKVLLIKIMRYRTMILLCFLNINRLCNNRNSKIIPCNTTTKAMEIINTPRFKVNNGLIINPGVNDVEHLTPEKL